ncbi:recombination endonuclease subunit [Escherichia phage vB_EcoM_ESCO47]|nr:recombination endonuclease subunit [Escherichia phage vB_EcoM_ESCO47]
MAEFSTGQQLLAVPEIKKYVLTNTFSGEEHIVTEEMLKNAFKNEYYKIMSNRSNAFIVSDYYD